MRFERYENASKDLQQKYRNLYEEAFPAIEKKPFSLMEELGREGKMELLIILEEDAFAGLAACMVDGTCAILDYFAIDGQKRSGGYGGKAIRLLKERYKKYQWILEIEVQDPCAENAEDRRRRKAFYLRNGLKETQMLVNVYQTDFELLTPDGTVTFEEYTGVLRNVLGEEGMELLHPVLLAGQKENGGSADIG